MSNKLKIYTLGRFKLEYNDVNITEGTDKKTKNWELFQYLITHRNRSIPQEEIISTLKLNENSDPVGSLSSLVYRLRKKLKNGIGSHAGNYIKRSGCAYSFNTQKDYWLDIEEFEHACNLTQKAVKEESEEWESSFDQVLQLYQGDYLEESKLRTWIWDTRNKYINLLISTLKKLSDHLCQHNKHDELCQYYAEVNQLIGFDEDLLCKFIESLLQTGNTALAHQKYNEIVKMFEENDLILPHEIKNLKDSFPKKTNDNPELILETIKENIKKENAYICSAETFIRIFKLELRRSGRNPPPRYLAHFSIDGKYDESILKKIGTYLFEMITNQLRCCDVICRWDQRHIVTLLTQLDKTEAEKVLERLHNSFYYLYDIPDGIELKKDLSEIKEITKE
ncbi:MAG: BTAD domain-containing putative transcriptional regulator [Bacillota bacterium]